MSVAIVWFREDLRLADNPALVSAVGACQRVLPVFIEPPGMLSATGSASRVWLADALRSLARDLAAIGLPLWYLRGAPKAVLERLVDHVGATALTWNRRYSPEDVEIDRAVKAALTPRLEVRSFASRLLHEPFEIANRSGKPFLVFTPFYKHCRAQLETAAPLPAPASVQPFVFDETPSGLDGEQVGPAFVGPDCASTWAARMRRHWHITEAAAQARLASFAAGAVVGYHSDRDVPARNGVSELSPYLHFGMLTPHQIWQEVYAVETHTGHGDVGREAWTRQLFWRDFAHHLLYHFPHTIAAPLKSAWEAFPWVENADHLLAWQRGLTGYPFVDAGMRQLWETGYMHNRVRMVVGSFLTKHLGIAWQEGAAWFHDTLFDADLANNTLGWQWVAGCGADAAPYFRIFNPIAQGEKFDSAGDYIRRWVPELSELPAPWLHEPSAAPRDILARAGVMLGETYPVPIVAHKPARLAALARYDNIKL